MGGILSSMMSEAELAEFMREQWGEWLPTPEEDDKERDARANAE